MMLRQMALSLIALGVPWTPLIGAPHWSNFPGSNFPASPGAVTLSGKVQAADFFAQTFLIRLDDGSVETVPFSRWTGFLRVSRDSKGADSKGGESKVSASREEMDPSEVGTGDRLHILLDPSQSTAERIEVLPREKQEKRVHNSGSQALRTSVVPLPSQ